MFLLKLIGFNVYFIRFSNLIIVYFIFKFLKFADLPKYRIKKIFNKFSFLPLINYISPW